MQSLSRRFQVSLGVMSLVITVLATLGVFLVFQRELSYRQITFLADYVQLLGPVLQPAALSPLPDMPAVREACVAYILPVGMSFLDALAPAVTATVQ